MVSLDKLQKLGLRIVTALSLDELQSLATKLFAERIAKTPIEQVIEYIASNRSFVEEAWSRLRPEVKKRIKAFIKDLPKPFIEKMVNPKTIVKILEKSGRSDILSLFVNDPRARQWLVNEIKKAKCIVFDEC